MAAQILIEYRIDFRGTIYSEPFIADTVILIRSQRVTTSMLSLSSLSSVFTQESHYEK